MLEIVLSLWGIGKEHKTIGGVLTGPFWPTDTTRSQHSDVATTGRAGLLATLPRIIMCKASVDTFYSSTGSRNTVSLNSDKAVVMFTYSGIGISRLYNARQLLDDEGTLTWRQPRRLLRRNRSGVRQSAQCMCMIRHR